MGVAEIGIKMSVRNGARRISPVQRLRVFANGGLLEVQRIAHQKSFVNFADAAFSDIGLVRPI